MDKVKQFIDKHNFSIANIIVHVIVIAIFIVTLFFTYGVYIEKKVFKKQIDIFVNDNLEEIKIFAPDFAENIKSKVKNLQFKDLSKEDKIVEEANSKMIKQAIRFMLGGVGIAVILVVLIYIFSVPSENKTNFMSNSNNFIRKLIKYNILSLVFIGITEIIFLTVYGSNYEYIDNNKIKKSALSTLNKLFSNIPIPDVSIVDFINKGNEVIKINNEVATNVPVIISTISEIDKNKVDNNLVNFGDLYGNKDLF